MFLFEPNCELVRVNCEQRVHVSCLVFLTASNIPSIGALPKADMFQSLISRCLPNRKELKLGSAAVKPNISLMSCGFKMSESLNNLSEQQYSPEGQWSTCCTLHLVASLRNLLLFQRTYTKCSSKCHKFALCVNRESSHRVKGIYELVLSLLPSHNIFRDKKEVNCIYGLNWRCSCF